MPSWVILLLGTAVIAGLILVARRWGKADAERKILEKNIKAARTRKAIDNETEKLSGDELAARLRRFM